jgi:hypothetical protein
MKHLRQTKLLKEASHLLVLLRHLGELRLDNLLQLVLEFVLECADGRWNNMA